MFLFFVFFSEIGGCHVIRIAFCIVWLPVSKISRVIICVLQEYDKCFDIQMSLVRRLQMIPPKLLFLLQLLYNSYAPGFSVHPFEYCKRNLERSSAAHFTSSPPYKPDHGTTARTGASRTTTNQQTQILEMTVLYRLYSTPFIQHH